MNALAKYLKQNNENSTSFSRRSGIPQPTIWRIMKGKFIPSPETALKIEKATNGAVSRIELLYPYDSNDCREESMH